VRSMPSIARTPSPAGSMSAVPAHDRGDNGSSVGSDDSNEDEGARALLDWFKKCSSTVASVDELSRSETLLKTQESRSKTQASADPPFHVPAPEARLVETCVGVGEHLALAACEPRAASNAASVDDQRLEKTQASASPPLPVAASEVRPAEKSVGVDEPLALAKPEQMEKTPASAHPPLPVAAFEPRPLEKSVASEDAQQMDAVARPNARLVDSGDHVSACLF
jgi:hypothetical protein